MATILSTSTFVQPATITVSPPINNQQFQGYYIHTDNSSSLENINCPSGQSLFTTQQYAECCSIGATTCSTFWTSCLNPTVAVGVTYNQCGPSSYCQTVSIFDQLPIDPDATVHSQVICAESNFPASSIYRTVLSVTSTTAFTVFTSVSTSAVPAASSTAVASSAVSTSTTAAAAAGVQTESNAQTGSQTTSGLASTAGENNNQASQTGSVISNNSSPNLSWIAGAVIGPILGLALLALLIWSIRAGKWKKRSPAMGANGSMMHDAQSPPAYPAAYYQDPQKTPVLQQQQSYELGHNQSHELSGNPAQYELPGSNEHPAPYHD